MQSTTTTMPLVSLKSGNVQLTNTNEDILRRTVVDRDGQEVGRVDDVFVDPTERRARFLAVKSGDILGFGGKKFLIPVEAIHTVDADQVMISETRDRILGGPEVDEDAERSITTTSPGTMGETDRMDTAGAGEPVVIAVYRWYRVDQPYWSPSHQRRDWA